MKANEIRTETGRSTREPNSLSKSALVRSPPSLSVRSSVDRRRFVADERQRTFQLRLMGVQGAGSGGDSDSLLSEPSAGEHCLRQAR